MSGERLSDVSLVSVDFEVFGKVQGVYFRKYTREEAVKKNLRGYVKNTERGTVVGTLEGDLGNVGKMKNWLAKKGSPASRIEKVIFTNEKKIEKLQYTSFDIHR